MPDHHSEGRGSTFFPVSIRVTMAGVMVGSQELDEDERVAKRRPILVKTMGSTSPGNPMDIIKNQVFAGFARVLRAGTLTFDNVL
jgi:hypothetical protein